MDKVFAAAIAIFCIFTGFVFYDAYERAEQCKTAGGVYARGLCLKASSIISK